MEKTAYTLDEKVDYFLHRIASSPTLTLDARSLYEVEILNEENYLVDQVMLEKGLIKIEGGTRVITGKGLEISNFGGWSLYQKMLKKENQREFLESDKNLRRFEWENARLKKRVLEVEQELKASIEKESASQNVIRYLIKQNKSSKITYLITGTVMGVVLAGAAWLFLMQ